jgi:dienelactone hydrolase
MRFALLALFAGSLFAAPQDARQQIKATLFITDPLPPLAAVSYGTFEPMPGVVAERISYETQFGMRVPAMLYRPAKLATSKAPAIIVVNGHGGDKYSWYAFYTGMLYAQAGAFVITYDPIGEGERNAQRKDGTRQHDGKVPPSEMARRMSGLMITDLMQAVSYLSQRPEVDPKRIAAAGYSMGSFVLSLACAVETRLNACVLAGGGDLDGRGGYWDTSKPMCQGIPYQSLTFLGDRAAALFDLHATRGSTLILNGSADTVVAIPTVGTTQFFEDLRRRTIALHGSGKNVFDFAYEPGGGHRPYFLTRPAALWLERRLHFPNGTAAQIAKMPETHISEWSQRENVSLDPLYATELREGGTQALGAGIPGVAHDQLNAVPRAEWERDKEKFIYETWIARAKALVK